MEALLRWAGSKRRLLPRLEPFWSSRYQRYVEPFAGSACLFFSLEPSSAVLGDLNDDLINTYKTIRANPEGVAEILDEWEVDRGTYYRVRDEAPIRNASEAAARFVYLNRLCFNGLYRTNKDGHFNVPYGAERAGPMPDRRALSRAANMLTGVELVAGDFSTVLERTRTGDFVYMDPPYRVTSRRVFREYQAGEFTSSDLDRLSAWLTELDAHGVTFVVSYADSREGRRLGDGFSSRRVRVRRNIAGFAKHRRTAYELLISNGEIP